MRGNFRTSALRTSCLVACASAVAAASPAWAQTSTAQATPGTTTNTGEATVVGLEEVVVTAQKRSESLQRAAVAVSAVSGSDIVKASVSDVQGLTLLVPALVVQPSVGTATNFYVRGVGSFAANAFSDNPIAFNYGGVYVARPAAPLGTFYDLERVEVLKGPQGTLYGRNATGGAINVIPARPSLSDRSGEVLLEYGNYDAWKASAVLNQPLSDSVALRVAAQFVDRHGYLSDGYDGDDGKAVRVSLLSRPNDRVSLLLVADYFHQGGKGGGAVLAPGAVSPTAPAAGERIGATDPRSTAALLAADPFLVGSGLVITPSDTGFVKNEFWGVALTADVDLGPATLTILPAYRHSNPDYQTWNGGYLGRVDETAQQSSLEVRLTSNGRSRLGYVLGGYLFDEVQNDFNDFNQGLLLDTRFQVDARNQSAALFGQATYEIRDGFRLVGGGRYTHDRKTMSTVYNQLTFGAGPTQDFSGKVDFDSFNFKAGFEWDAGPESLVYGNVATGYKAGGFFIAPLDNTFKPEKLTAFTLGSKNRFLDNRLQANLELFYWKYRDQQVNFVGGTRTSDTTTGIGLVTSNAGQSRMYGAEADVAWQATPQDRFDLNVQYLNAKYEDFRYVLLSPVGAPPRLNCAFQPSTASAVAPPAASFDVDCSGRPQINSPKWTANLGYEHIFALGGDRHLIFGARTRLESGRYLSPEYLPEEYQKPYSLSDAYLTLEGSGQRWSLTGYVNNIENRTVLAGSNIRAILPVVYDILRPPRTYGVRLGFRF